MKNLIAICLTLGCFLLGTTDLSAQKDNYDAFTVRVDGLGCPYCAYGLEKKFKEFTGIADIKIDMETGIFNFSYPAAKPLTINKVQDQVRAAGYTPVSLEVTRADGSVETGKMELPEIEVTDAMVTKTLFVAGNCGMCAKRIEFASREAGAARATWNEETQQLEVIFDPSDTTLTEIAKSVAAVGHDSELVKTEKANYKSLPECCKYKRIKS